jgi:hypothetical protein
MKDLSKVSTSLTAAIEPLLSTMDKLSLNELKESTLSILNDPNVHASDKTRNKWKLEVTRSKSSLQMMHTLKNIYLKGSGLGV